MAAFRLTRDAADSYNNSVWFLVESKYVMWVFVGQALASDRNRRGAGAVAVLVVALSIPSTVAWARSKAQEGGALDAEDLALVSVLSERCRDGLAVVAPSGGERDPASSRGAAEIVTLAGCRAPLAGPFAKELVSRDEMDTRQRDMRSFWEAWHTGSLRSDILLRYQIGLVVERIAPQRSPRPLVGVDPVFECTNYAVYLVACSRGVSQTSLACGGAGVGSP
jgi:hypothetical protein